VFPGIHGGYCSDCSLGRDTVSSFRWIPIFQGSMLPLSQYFSGEFLYTVPVGSDHVLSPLFLMDLIGHFP
jgi:hypothetical protein